MGWSKFSKADFYFDFYEKRSVPGIYRRIFYKNSSEPIYINPQDDSEIVDTEWYVKFVPSYFNCTISGLGSLKSKKVFRVKGYAINLKNNSNVDEYLSRHFRPSFRTSLRRREKGLETCFNVQYKMFFRSIDPEVYEALMQTLQDMLVRRFDQRNDQNLVLNRWSDFTGSVLSMIKEKKASLFVIYDNLKPVQISLSYHHNNIMFLAIPSYDIDYAKFGLGNLSIKKLIQWCIDNKYDFLDMGYGAFDYKVKWCNENYNFHHHLFYNKSSLLSILTVYGIIIKTKLINFLIEKKVNVVYHQIKDFIFRKEKFHQGHYTILKDPSFSTETQNFIKVNPIKDYSYKFLRKALYDFAYTNSFYVHEIEVFELKKNTVYCIKANEKSQIVAFEA